MGSFHWVSVALRRHVPPERVPRVSFSLLTFFGRALLFLALQEPSGSQRSEGDEAALLLVYSRGLADVLSELAERRDGEGEASAVGAAGDATKSK